MGDQLNPHLLQGENNERIPREGGIPIAQNNQPLQNQIVPELDEDNMLFGEFMIPPSLSVQTSVIYPPFGVDNFQIRPDVINLFSNNNSFYGRTDENPYLHINRFVEVCGNFKYPNVNDEEIKMRLFVHTLKDRAREWLDTLPPRSITNWSEFVQKFTTKYFPPIKVAKLKYEISTFRQQDSESFNEAWERYKDMLRKCPNHGFNLGAQVNFFYSGLTPSCRANTDSSSNDSLGNKTMREAYNLFEVISEQSARWPDRNVQKKPNGVLEVDDYSLMLSKIEALSKKVEDISLSTPKAVKAVQTQQISVFSCEICGATHNTNMCPLIQQEPTPHIHKPSSLIHNNHPLYLKEN
ncbi:hypothetical protein OROMI_012804 [Orobanche minor]